MHRSLINLEMRERLDACFGYSLSFFFLILSTSEDEDAAAKRVGYGSVYVCCAPGLHNKVGPGLSRCRCRTELMKYHTQTADVNLNNL